MEHTYKPLNLQRFPHIVAFGGLNTTKIKNFTNSKFDSIKALEHIKMHKLKIEMHLNKDSLNPSQTVYMDDEH